MDLDAECIQSDITEGWILGSLDHGSWAVSPRGLGLWFQPFCTSPTLMRRRGMSPKKAVAGGLGCERKRQMAELCAVIILNLSTSPLSPSFSCVLSVGRHKQHFPTTPWQAAGRQAFAAMTGYTGTKMANGKRRNASGRERERERRVLWLQRSAHNAGSTSADAASVLLQ